MRKGEQMQEFYVKDGNVNLPLDRKSVSIPLIMMETNKHKGSDPDFLANFGGDGRVEALDRLSGESGGVEMQHRK